MKVRIERIRNSGVPRTLAKPSGAGIVMTTGQVADYTGVAPRTVCKWVDAGHLKGYRLPGSEDRRIPVKSLLEFLKARGWHIEASLLNLVNPKKTIITFGLSAGVVAPIESETLDVVRAESTWELARRTVEANSIGVVVIGPELPLFEARAILAGVRADTEWKTVCCHGPDQTSEMFPDADMVLDATLPGPEITAAVLGFLNKEFSW